ncbi:MAG: MCE family protein [Deltaproteobacteria bacterium]|nr:MCE family protein [Deltaproteobacteria bacterium]
MTGDYSRRQEISVGLFVLIAIAGLVYLSFRIGGGKPAQAVHYDLVFDSALGLQRDNVVTVAGVRVGLVDEISVDDGRARVRIAVAPDLVLYPDATAAVRARTLLGEKYVDLVPGKGPGEALRPGAVIDQTIPTVEIDQVIRGAEEVIGRVNRILPTFQTAVEKIDGLVRRSDVDATAKSLGDVLDETAHLIKSLGDLTKASGEDARVLLAELRQRSPQVLTRIEQAAERIDQLAVAVPTEEMAAAIRRAPQAVENADRALADLRVAVADLRRIAQQGTTIAGSLEKLLDRAEKIDEKTLREFMQVQGVRVNLTTDPNILRRIRELKYRELPTPLPAGEEGAASSLPAPLP